MRFVSLNLLCLGLLVVAARPTVSAECCGVGECVNCRAKWENKKTKKPQYWQTCSEECVRGVDAWCDHGCGPECAAPPAHVLTRKKLVKKELDKVERVLKYDAVQSPVDPCLSPPCQPAYGSRHSCRHCSPAWYDVPALLARCLGL